MSMKTKENSWLMVQVHSGRLAMDVKKPHRSSWLGQGKGVDQSEQPQWRRCIARTALATSFGITVMTPPPWLG